MWRNWFCGVFILGLCLLFPSNALAGNGGGTGGSPTGFTGLGNGTGIAAHEPAGANQGTNNAGDASQILTQQSNQNQNRETPDYNNSGTCEQILQQTRDRLQLMLQDQTLQQEDWSIVSGNLMQLKNEYRTRAELRQEIWNAFELGLQNSRRSGSAQEVEKLLREMISLEPGSTKTYQELGTLFQNRGEIQCHLWCNGGEVLSETPPIIKSGRTLVPIRALSEALGAQVEWRQEEQVVLINKGDTQIRLQVQSQIALVNGQAINLDVPADIIDSRLFVPLRFCARAFDADIAYYPQGSMVILNQR